MSRVISRVISSSPPRTDNNKTLVMLTIVSFDKIKTYGHSNRFLLHVSLTSLMLDSYYGDFIYRV